MGRGVDKGVETEDRGGKGEERERERQTDRQRDRDRQTERERRGKEERRLARDMWQKRGIGREGERNQGEKKVREGADRMRRGQIAPFIASQAYLVFAR